MKPAQAMLEDIAQSVGRDPQVIAALARMIVFSAGVRAKAAGLNLVETATFLDTICDDCALEALSLTDVVQEHVRDRIEEWLGRFQARASN